MSATRMIENAPALDIDQQIANIRARVPEGGADAPYTLNANQKLERRIVWNFLKYMQGAGWPVYQVYDGDEFTKIKDDNAKAVMELVFNLDEVSIRFRKTPRAAEHGVLFVLGEGDTILTDWNYSTGDADGFDKVMNGFKSEDYA